MTTADRYLDMISPINGLPDEETAIWKHLVCLWRQKKVRNTLRYEYYTQKQGLKDFGISLPDRLKNSEIKIGWAQKAVDALLARSQFDGFTFDDQNWETEDLIRDICRQNNLNQLYKQASRSELISSCAFWTVSRGNVAIGEPSAIINAYQATYGSCEWDRRKKRVKHGLTIVDTEMTDTGEEVPTCACLYTDTDTWEITKINGVWTSRRNPHTLGRPMFEPMVYKPTLERPLGNSRITRSVMTLVDCAQREAFRTEASAEFFTAPQKYILGADEDLFEGQTQMETYIGNWLAISRDTNGDIPQVGMFNQGTMQPHTDYMRALASRFSCETNIPVSMLGVIHDNPSSAEAINAELEPLLQEAEELNQMNGKALVNVALIALACAKNCTLEELSEVDRSIMANWKNKSTQSPVSKADRMAKAVSVVPSIAESDVALEELGFTESQRQRITQAKKSQQWHERIMATIDAGEKKEKEQAESEN